MPIGMLHFIMFARLWTYGFGRGDGKSLVNPHNKSLDEDNEKIIKKPLFYIIKGKTDIISNNLLNLLDN